METVWFIILVCMLGAYVALDGFDLGAGTLHLFVARNDQERRMVLGSIGPLWDGNEVWLIASGGVLVFAFPRRYSAGFSGFYLPLMMALWLLLLRGISIEFRSHDANPLWRSFWDGVFFLSSSLMAVILGAALGNVIRGVPLDATGFFPGPLFTDFRTGGHPGALDWYTVLIGVFMLCALAAHGSNYLVWKTTGALRERALQAGCVLWTAVTLLLIPTTIATAAVQPALYEHLLSRPATWPLAVLAFGSLAAVIVFRRQQRELPAFLASAAFLVGLLGATAAGIYPNLLVSTLNPSDSLDIYRSAAGGIGMRIGLLWWTPAILLALGYFTYLFHSFRGKVEVSNEGHGY